MEDRRSLVSAGYAGESPVKVKWRGQTSRPTFSRPSDHLNVGKRLIKELSAYLFQSKIKTEITKIRDESYSNLESFPEQSIVSQAWLLTATVWWLNIQVDQVDYLLHKTEFYFIIIILKYTLIDKLFLTFFWGNKDTYNLMHSELFIIFCL